jgi:hypothetical protein
VWVEFGLGVVYVVIVRAICLVVIRLLGSRMVCEEKAARGCEVNGLTT